MFYSRRGQVYLKSGPARLPSAPNPFIAARRTRARAHTRGYRRVGNPLLNYAASSGSPFEQSFLGFREGCLVVL